MEPIFFGRTRTLYSLISEAREHVSGLRLQQCSNDIEIPIKLPFTEIRLVLGVLQNLRFMDACISTNYDIIYSSPWAPNIEIEEQVRLEIGFCLKIYNKAPSGLNTIIDGSTYRQSKVVCFSNSIFFLKSANILY